MCQRNAETKEKLSQVKEKTESDLVWQHVVCEITVPQKLKCWFFPNFITLDATWSRCFQRRHWILSVLLGAQPGARASPADQAGATAGTDEVLFHSVVFLHPFFTVQGTIQIYSVVVAPLVTVNLGTWNILLLCPDFYPNFVNFIVF